MWDLVRVVRSCDNADHVRQIAMLMGGKGGISINMPCAPMPVSEGEAAAFMHQRLVTSLTGNQPYYTRGGTVLKYKLHIDPENSAHLTKMDSIDWMGATPMHHYDGVTGLHLSLGPDCTLKNVQYWVNEDGTTAKAASRLMKWAKTL